MCSSQPPMDNDWKTSTILMFIVSITTSSVTKQKTVAKDTVTKETVAKEEDTRCDICHH